MKTLFQFLLYFPLLLATMFACLLSISISLLPGCEKNVVSPTENYGMITGVVKNTSGSFIEGVTISVADNSVVSDNNGHFSMRIMANTDRLVVNFTKQGYSITSKIAKIQVGLESYLEAVMKAYENSVTISSGIGGKATTSNGGSVIIDANALVDFHGNPYSGQATIGITTFDPTKETELNCFPGAFEGVTASGDVKHFESYGFIDIAIMDNNGNTLQLASGQTAMVEIPIAPNLISTAPSSIPRWYYDTTDGRWHEDGSAIKTGNVYRGSVTHFSPWNDDDLIDWLCLIRGRVVDANGNPIKGAIVLIRGADGAGPAWSAGDNSVGEDGVFSINVAADRQATIQVIVNGISGVQKYITTCLPGGIKDIGDISIYGFVAGETDVAFWNFEEGIADTPAGDSTKVFDISGNGHHGIAYNGPIYRNSPVATGSSLALEFDGLKDRVFVSDHSDFYMTNSFTISAYIRVDSKPSGTGTDLYHMILFRGDTRGGLDPYWLGITPDGRVRFNINNAFNQEAAVVSENPVTIGNFVHVEAILNDATNEMKLFINGSLEGTQNTSIRPFGKLSSSSKPGLGIGCEQTGAYFHFDGIIDDIRITK